MNARIDAQNVIYLRSCLIIRIPVPEVGFQANIEIVVRLIIYSILFLSINMSEFRSQINTWRYQIRYSKMMVKDIALGSLTCEMMIIIGSIRVRLEDVSAIRYGWNCILTMYSNSDLLLENPLAFSIGNEVHPLRIVRA